MTYKASKYVGSSALRQNTSKHIKVLDIVALGQDKSVAITKVGEKQFLIGVTSGSINLISELSNEDLIEIDVSNSVDYQEKFRDMLSKAKNTKNNIN